jgi:hypothetical protein
MNTIRHVAAAGVVASVVGGPYLATETEVGRNLTGSVRQLVGSPSDRTSSGTSQVANAHYATEQLWDAKLGERSLENLVGESPQSLVGGPVADFRDVLRFDITPDWVTRRYARVTTVLSELQLEGFRVPLVTGTRPDDIAGTVTYYFRHDGRLQRVSLHGFTGDPSRVIELMTQHYGMQPRPTLDTGVYTVEWNGRPTSVLKITRAPVMYADATHHRHTVFLELNQPHVDYGLSREASRIVASDWSTGRW